MKRPARPTKPGKDQVITAKRGKNTQPVPGGDRVVREYLALCADIEALRREIQERQERRQQRQQAAT